MPGSPPQDRKTPGSQVSLAAHPSFWLPTPNRASQGSQHSMGNSGKGEHDFPVNLPQATVKEAEPNTDGGWGRLQHCWGPVWKKKMEPKVKPFGMSEPEP